MSKQNGQETYSMAVEKALMSRRRFLQGTAGLASLLAVAQLTAACGARLRLPPPHRQQMLAPGGWP